MDKKMVFKIDYSLEGTDITHEIIDGYLIVKSHGMEIKSYEKVTEKTNLDALALAMVSEAKQILKQNGVKADFIDCDEFDEMWGEEICPYCDHVNDFVWAEGTKRTIICKNCGKEILLCSLCDMDKVGCGKCPYDDREE